MLSEFESDPALEAVVSSLSDADPDRTRMGAALRRTLDQLYDGQNTGRYRWDQLFKTEKTHCGTLVEINLQREFAFNDGVKLDYQIANVEVDCKYSQRDGGWMIPNEAHGQLCLVVTADDSKSTWSAGVVRASIESLNLGRNRDAKATLSARGRQRIYWFAHNAELPPNVLLSLPAADIEGIFAPKSGQARINELFRRAQRRRISRGVVATVAQQSDYMKRIRGNGGARTALRNEGIVILGHYGAHQRIANQLGLQRLERGESMSVRLTHASSADSWTSEFDGGLWRVANSSDGPVVAPALPKVSRAG
jgi:hypothetical protein